MLASAVSKVLLPRLLLAPAINEVWSVEWGAERVRSVATRLLNSIVQSDLIGLNASMLSITSFNSFIAPVCDNNGKQVKE